MERLCVLLVLLVSVSATEAQSIIFPGQSSYAEGDPCRTRSGGSGTCSRSCQQLPSFEEPLRCGNADSSYLVCCDTALDGSPDNLDVSPPPLAFDCSTSRPQLLGAGSSGLPASANNAAGGGKVFGGGPIPLHTTWPWMALIGTRVADLTEWQCAGMLINEHWVLSHADCFLNDLPRVVRLGEYDYNDDFDGAAPQDFEVAEKVLYFPEYSQHQPYDGLILIRLNPTVTLQKYISPVCLPWGTESRKNITGHTAKVLSFGNGFIGSGTLNTVQKEVEVTVFSVAQCVRNYSKLPGYKTSWPRGMGQETLCAGDPAGGRDACQGDSGGPLVSQDNSGRYVAAGIVSRGYRCGHKDFPGIYINLRYPPYLAWIKKVAFATP